ILPHVDIHPGLKDVLGHDLHIVHGEETEEGRRRVMEVHPDRVAVYHLGRLRYGAEQADSGPGFARLDHAVNAEDHVLCREVLPIPPLDVLMKMEDIGQTRIVHLPAFGQVADDFIRFERVKLHYLVIHRANRGVGEKRAGDVGVPHLRIARIENICMAPIHPPSRSRAGRRRHRSQRHGPEPEASSQTSLEEAPPGDLPPTVSLATGLPVHSSPPAPLSMMRSKFQTIAAASKSVPSWNFTPLCNRNTYTLPLSCTSQASTCSGMYFLCLSTVTPPFHTFP